VDGRRRPGRCSVRPAPEPNPGSDEPGGAERSKTMAEIERRNPVTKAVQMIAWMADSGEKRWGIRQAARGLGIPPSTAHRTVSMLEAAGVVTTDGEGRYSFSLEFIRLASRIALDVPLRRAAMPHMQALVDRTDETAYLGLYNGDRTQMMYIECIESHHPVRYVLPMYEWMPLYAGAGGEAILAFLPSDEIESILANTDLKPLTDLTITDPAELKRELDEIRERGYAATTGRLIEGAMGIAAPIYGPEERVIGDVVLALPQLRVDAPRGESLGAEVAACADAVSADLGGRPRDARRPRQLDRQG
jgi:IclR family transcriptional regulator, acetate operon repressor